MISDHTTYEHRSSNLCTALPQAVAFGGGEKPGAIPTGTRF